MNWDASGDVLCAASAPSASDFWSRVMMPPTACAIPMTYRANIREDPGAGACASACVELFHMVEEGRLIEVSARGRFLSDTSQQAASDALASDTRRLQS